jgi:group I intron endonuclease
MASVYLLTNTVNGKLYVGFTTKTVEQRWRQHRKDSSHGRHNITRAIRKYGPAAFEVRALATDLSEDFALALETAAILSLDTLAPAGYNLTTGGDRPTFSAETRARISVSMTGKKLSHEQKERLRLLNTGRVASDETKAKISAANKGKRNSKEAIERAAAKLRGRKRDPAATEKTAASHRGRAHTPEHVERQAAAQREAKAPQREAVLVLVAQGISQAEAARRTGIHPTTVYRWVKRFREG